MRNGGEHEGDGRLGCEQGVVAGPGCVLGQQIRAERPASRARGGGLTGACQGRIGVVVGFGWAGPQLVAPTHCLAPIDQLIASVLAPWANSSSWSRAIRASPCPWMAPMTSHMESFTA